MIRINLLPTNKAQSRVTTGSGDTQLWMGIYAAGIAISAGVAAYFYFTTQGQLDEVKGINSQLQARVEEVQARSSRRAELETRLAQSRRLEEVVGELERARSGPTRILVELSKMLSVGGGPTIDPLELERIRQENPLAGFNQSWDARRLWLTEFNEQEGTCLVAGKARTNEDVAEFMRRMALSEVFGDVALRSTAADDGEDALPAVDFAIDCTVTY